MDDSVHRARGPATLGGDDASECGGGNLMRFHVNILSIIIIDDARRFRESRVPKRPEMKLPAARNPYSATESAISALLISISLRPCRRLILVHFRSLLQSYATRSPLAAADGWPAGGFRLSDFDGLAEKHELLRRGLRPAHDHWDLILL
jgi:hypothetical protein